MAVERGPGGHVGLAGMRTGGSCEACVEVGSGAKVCVGSWSCFGCRCLSLLNKERNDVVAKLLYVVSNKLFANSEVSP